MQFYSSIISFPWSIKLFYGLISDNLPIWGSKRRSYLILNGVLSLLCMLPLIIYSPNETSKKTSSTVWVITILLAINSMTGAFNDVVVDAILVAQARRD